jgi:hypothetical protein
MHASNFLPQSIFWSCAGVQVNQTEPVEHKSDVVTWNLERAETHPWQRPSCKWKGRSRRRYVLLPYGFNFVPHVFPNGLIQLAFVFGTANLVRPESLYLSHLFSSHTLGDDHLGRRGLAHMKLAQEKLSYMCRMALHHPPTNHCHRQVASVLKHPSLPP